MPNQLTGFQTGKTVKEPISSLYLIRSLRNLLRYLLR